MIDMSYCLNFKALVICLQFLTIFKLKKAGSRLFCFLFLCFIILCNFNFANAADEFYSSKEEGWFWYKDDEVEKKEEDIKNVVPRASDLSKQKEIDLDKELEKSESRTIDVHVRSLRAKLGESGALIKTIRNVGYMIDAEVKN